MTNEDPRRAVAPYGSWRSTIAPEALVAGVVRLAEVRWDGEDLLWLEGRPDDGGRATLVRLRPGGTPRDVSPPGIDVRTRVHEYGGAAFLADGDVLVVSDFATGRLLRVADDRTATPMTPEGPFRFADLELDRGRGRMIAVREDHAGPGEAVNALVAIPLDGSGAAAYAAIEVLVEGSDFVSSPRLSPDGTHLAWLRWDHPNLPWDGVECVVAELGLNGRPDSGRVVAGDASTWTSQPRWAPDGSLVVASERGEWMGLHRWDGERLAPLTAGDRRRVRRPRLGVRPRVARRVRRRADRRRRARRRARSPVADRPHGRAGVHGARPSVHLDHRRRRPRHGSGRRRRRAGHVPRARADRPRDRRLDRRPPFHATGARSRRCLCRRSRRVPDGRRSDRTRDPVPPDEPGVPGSRRGAAAARRDEPWGPDVGSLHRAEPGAPAADEPRPRRPRRRLRRQHGVRPGLPEAPRGDLGRDRRRRLHRRRAGAGPARRG